MSGGEHLRVLHRGLRAQAREYCGNFGKPMRGLQDLGATHNHRFHQRAAIRNR